MGIAIDVLPKLLPRIDAGFRCGIQVQLNSGGIVVPSASMVARQ